MNVFHFENVFFPGQSRREHGGKHRERRTSDELDWRPIFFGGHGHVYMGVSLNGSIPKTPQNDHFSRKTNGCWVPPF